MKICRFDDNRLGLVEGDDVIDVTAATDVLPILRWPYPIGDQLISNLDRVRERISALRGGPRRPVSDVRMLSPIANPGKILGSRGVFENDRGNNPQNGYFVKAGSSLVGPSQGIELRYPERDTFHEIELAAVIGRVAHKVKRDTAMDYIAGYTASLDMTLGGEEERSTRKSLDTYCVLGPWFVTADEFGDPSDVDLALDVDDEPRQRANTRDFIADVAEQVEIACRYFTLHPGDVILTGNPSGFRPVHPGETITVRIARVGKMEVPVR